MREMILAEWLPYALSIGVEESRFWTLNPRLLQPYIKAYRIKKREENSMLYVQGRYFLDALLCSVGNMFKSKTSKPFEYPKEPYSLFEEKIQLSEDEIKKQREQFVMSLKVMQSNFNRNHKKKGDDEQ